MEQTVITMAFKVKWIKYSICAAFTALAVSIYSCKTKHATTQYNFTAVKNDHSFERGKQLTYAICGGCHYNETDKKFTGKRFGATPKIAGKVFTANLTHNSNTGIIPTYSDAELIYLIKTGITHDGRFIPYMLRPNIADADMNDIIVYLRSSDAALASSPAAGETKLNLLGKMGKNFIAKPQPYKHNAAPNEQDEVAYGRYLVDNVGCYHCHSRKATSINYQQPEKTKGYMAGGAKAGKLRGPNLTFDLETGIGNWTKAEFREAVQHAVGKNEEQLRPPMEAFPLTNQQADAIYTYLKSLPPKQHKIKK